MPTLRVRLDDKLLHTEVLYACLPAFAPERLVVASRSTWMDSVDVESVPDEVEVQLVRPEALTASVDARVDTLVVLGSLADLEQAWDAGFRASEVVLANRAKREDAVALGPDYYADASERAVIGRLANEGVRFAIQRVPSAEPKWLHPQSQEPGP